MFQWTGRALLATAGAILAASVLLSAQIVMAQETRRQAPAPAKEPKGDAYALDFCVVTGEKLGGSMGDPIVKEYDGREIRFCCKGCPARFEKGKDAFLEKIDAAIVTQQLPYYPLDTCVVMGDKLGGEMGSPIEHVYKNRLIRLCCKGCVKDFEKSPAKYLAKIDEAAIAKQTPTYPLDICPIMGDKLGGEMGKPIDLVHGNRLVRLCCKGCVKDFRKDPLKTLAQLDQAVIRNQKPSYPLKTCPITGEKLGSMGAPVDFVYGNRLVRLCCKGCIKALRKNPDKALAMIDDAAKSAEGSVRGTGREGHRMAVKKAEGAAGADPHAGHNH